MKVKYILSGLINDKARSFEYYLLLAWSPQHGIYTLIRKKAQGVKFDKDDPWMQYHPPIRYVIHAAAEVSKERWETDVRAYVKKFKESVRKLDPKVTFKTGESDQIFFKTP